MSNFEYSRQELEDLDLSSLYRIADGYDLIIPDDTRKSEIIRQILNHQQELNRPARKRNKYENSFNQLPADIYRLLAFYLEPCDIVRLCRLNKKANTYICNNGLFLRDLGHIYLTDNDKILSKINILKEIVTVNDIITAARRGYLRKVEYLYPDTGINKHREAFFAAVRSGRLAVIKYLVRPPGSKSRRIKDISINDALNIAARDGRLPLVKYLISQGADLNERGDEMLREASKNGYLNVVKYLVSQGANIRKMQDVAFISAAGGGYLDIVDYLVSKGADLHARNEEALIQASIRGDLPLVKYLVSHGADIHVRRDDVLLYAVSNNRSAVVKYLLEHGDYSGERKNHMLEIAVRHHYDDIIQYLPDDGADINVYQRLQRDSNTPKEQSRRSLEEALRNNDPEKAGIMLHEFLTLLRK
jgi:ankyrin repeat protein